MRGLLQQRSGSNDDHGPTRARGTSRSRQLPASRQRHRHRWELGNPAVATTTVAALIAASSCSIRSGHRQRDLLATRPSTASRPLPQIAYRTSGRRRWTSPNGVWRLAHHHPDLLARHDRVADGQYESGRGGRLVGWQTDTTTRSSPSTTRSRATWPGCPTGTLDGTVALTASATDPTSGLAPLAIDYRSGNGAWKRAARARLAVHLQPGHELADQRPATTSG